MVAPIPPVREQSRLEADGIESWFEDRPNGRAAIASHPCADVPGTGGQVLAVALLIEDHGPIKASDRAEAVRRLAIAQVRHGRKCLLRFGFKAYVAAAQAQNADAAPR